MDNTTQAGNVLIAEFYGCEHIPAYNDNRIFKAKSENDIAPADDSYKEGFKVNGGYVPVDDLKYHTSWSWLMPVVEKIENLEGNYEVQIGKNLHSRPQQRYSCIIHNDGDSVSFEYEHTNESKIFGVWKMVVEFITWYNLQTKTKDK